LESIETEDLKVLYLKQQV